MTDSNPGHQSGVASDSFPFPRSEQDVRVQPAADADKDKGAEASTIDRMVRSAHGAVDQIAGKAVPAVESLRSTAADMSAMQEQWVTNCRDHVRQHPLASVLSAAVAGLVLGRLFAR